MPPWLTHTCTHTSTFYFSDILLRFQIIAYRRRLGSKFEVLSVFTDQTAELSNDMTTIKRTAFWFICQQFSLVFISSGRLSLLSVSYLHQEGIVYSAFVCLSVCLLLATSPKRSSRKNYWSGLHENFTGDVAVDKEGLIKFWTSSASESGLICEWFFNTWRQDIFPQLGFYLSKN